VSLAPCTVSPNSSDLRAKNWYETDSGFNVQVLALPWLTPHTWNHFQARATNRKAFLDPDCTMAMTDNEPKKRRLTESVKGAG
jgi:hypothetical protein